MTDRKPDRGSPDRRLYLTLLRHDRAFLALPWWALAGAVMGLLELSPGFHVSRLPMYGLLWSLCVMLLLSLRSTRRCEPLALALPVDPRALWLARVAAIAAVAFTFLATALAVVALAGLATGAAPALPTDTWKLGLHLAGASLLAFALLQAFDSTVFESTVHRGALVAATALLGGLLYAALWAYGRSPAWAGLLAVVALALLGVRYLDLPRAFTLAGVAPFRSPRVRAPGPGRSRVGVAGGDGKLSVARFVLVTLHRHWFSWIAFPVLPFLGCWRSGYLAGGLHGPALLVVGFAYLFAHIRVGLLRAPRLDALPISRRALFAALALPGFAALALGMVAGAVVSRGLSTTPLVRYGSTSSDPSFDVRVPLEFWEIGWNGPPQSQPEADGAATCTGWSTRLFRGAPAVLYSPFHVPTGSPPADAARALSRAVEAVYDRRIPPREIEQRYLDAGPDGRAVVRDAAASISAGDLPLRPRGWPRALSVNLAWIGVLWFGGLALGVRPLVGRRAALVIALILTVSLPVVLSASGISSEWKISALLTILVRKTAEAVPLPTALLSATALGCVYAVYSWARRCFERVELHPARGES